MNGGTPKTGVAEYWGGKHQWITPAEMGKRSSPYVSQTERTLTDAGLQNSSARPMPKHSVILSSRAPIGHLIINTVPMSTNQGCKGLIPGKEIDYKFLYYFLGANVDLLNSLGTGTTFKELSAGKLKEISLPVPPLDEQQRIVGLAFTKRLRGRRTTRSSGPHPAVGGSVAIAASVMIHIPRFATCSAMHVHNFSFLGVQWRFENRTASSLKFYHAARSRRIRGCNRLPCGARRQCF